MHPLAFLFTLSLLLPGLARAAECVRPEASVQTSEETRLKGEVEVTILSLGGGGGSIDRERSASWETQLPSQTAVDNQWYLFHICKEYEARRISRESYCVISAGLWERIVGKAIPVEGCGTAAVASAAPTQTVSVDLAGPATPQPQELAAPAGPVTIPRGRWSMLSADGGVVDVFGPVRVGGKEMWYSENDAGCLSVIQRLDGVWVERIVAGPCSPWPDITLAATPTELTLVTAGDTHVFDFVDASPGRPPDGSWAGALGFADRGALTEGPAEGIGAFMEAVRVVDSALKPSQVQFRVELDVDARGGSVRWEASRCTTRLTEPRTGAGWVQFTERAEAGSGCIDGAKVTLQALSTDTVLMQWAGDGQAAQGMLRLGP